MEDGSDQVISTQPCALRASWLQIHSVNDFHYYICHRRSLRSAWCLAILYCFEAFRDTRQVLASTG